jgi:serine/threonine protein kinase
MGTVYRAHDRRLDITVAVKELNRTNLSEDDMHASLHNFEREARLLARLSHPRLPKVTDYFIVEPRFYLIMEYIQGDNLQKHLAAFEEKPDFDSALQWSIEIAEVLAYLHGQKPPIIFRDIKPANIMVDKTGGIKLIDFGIARRFQEGATKDTLLYGSPGYSPPEQYGKTQTDPRSDIYAFGATMHQLFSGRDPITSPFRFPPLRSLVPAAPPALENLIAKCVEMDIDHRPSSSEAIWKELLAIQQNLKQPDHIFATENSRTAQNISPAFPTTSEKKRSSSSRYALMAIILLLSIIIAIGGYFLSKKNMHTIPPAAALKKLSTPPPPQLSQINAEPMANGATLKITSTPAEIPVKFDGKQVGSTPIQLSNVSSGKHTLQLMPDPSTGYEEATREINIPPDQPFIIVDTELAPLAPPAINQGPYVQVQRITVQPGISRTPSMAGYSSTGILLTADFRMMNAADMDGLLCAYFYGPDSYTPLQPAIPDTNYQTLNGQLCVSGAIHSDTNSEDFKGITLYVPDNLFPIPAKNVYYRMVIMAGGNVVWQSNALPLLSTQGN